MLTRKQREFLKRPFPIYISAEKMAEAGLNEGDIITLRDQNGDYARDSRTGIPVHPQQKFRVVAS